MSATALPPGPPEVPQAVWDAIVGIVSFVAGWVWRHFTGGKKP
ncbi:MAG TPA: hypothetical protein VNM39_15925 [Verrucomicrobiae bacterium]|nr:hypothetical protein [Verrucomicrobiae bacterium]